VDQLLAAIEELDNLMFYVQKRAREEPFEEMPDSSERRLEPFSYRKLRRSISRALAKSEHNQATDGLVEEISQQAMLEATPIEDDLDDLPSGLASPRRVISAERLGRMVLDRLARLGWLPYARYLSVFDPDSFMNETKSQDKKTQMERERLV
jgi:transcriptional regulator NrdR family protein